VDKLKLTTHGIGTNTKQEDMEISPRMKKSFDLDPVLRQLRKSNPLAMSVLGE
jgi:hypothetical protein